MRTLLRSYSPLLWQLMRFGITGGLATLTHFLTVILFVEFTQLQPLSANVLGFCFGFIVSFSGHRFWTFSATTQRTRTALPRFLFLAIGNFICNQSLYYVLLTKLHWSYTTALVIVLGIMAAITFLISKLWVFRP